MLKIFDTISALRNYKTDVKAFNYLAKRGILSEGYNPMTDSYEQRLHLTKKIQFVLSSTGFTPTSKAEEIKLLPFVPPPPKKYLRKKYEVVNTATGEVRRYRRALDLARALTEMRAQLIEDRFREARIKRNKDNHARLKAMGMQVPHRLMKQRLTGGAPSLLECAPVENTIIISNLETGRTISRAPMF